MIRSVRRACMAAVGVAALACLWAEPVHAAPPAGGLEVRVQSDDPLSASVRLTNRDAGACQVATTSYGTVLFTRVEQAGGPIEPVFVDVELVDRLDVLVLARLRALAPGQSVDLALDVVPLGPSGHALKATTWSPAARGIAAFYPIVAHEPLRLDIIYAVPGVAASGPPLCAPAAGASDGGDGGRDSIPLWWALAAVGAVALLAAGAAAVFVRRRRRRGRRLGASAVVMLLVLGLAGVDWAAARPAHAVIDVPDNLAAAWASCLAVFQMPGGDPANILATLQGPQGLVTLYRSNHTEEYKYPPNDIRVDWDPDDYHKFVDSEGSADPCTSLYHELYHAYEDIALGGRNNNDCITDDSGRNIRVSEAFATQAENRLRRKLGLPARTHYNGLPVPADGAPCVPFTEGLPPRPHRPCPALSSCADGEGDPHLRTFDGKLYDFQAVGEFVAARAPGFEIQLRQQAVAGSRVVSVITAVAMNVAGDQVQVRQSGSGLSLTVDGAARPLASATLPAGATVTVVGAPDGQAVVVSWSDGSRATVTPISVWALHVSVEWAKARSSAPEGLFGDADGDANNDIRPRGGASIANPTFADLYPGFADSWRVEPTMSLFTYDAGTDTDSFTDKTLPDREVTVDTLPGRAALEALCRRFGVTDAHVLAACALDVGLTGQPSFAVAARASQDVLGLSTGAAQFVRVTQPGGTARLTFAGTLGQRVFVRVVSTTLPDQCGVLTLVAPGGRDLATGCVKSGAGFVDGTLLPTTGQYAIVVDPQDDSVGEVELSIISTVDQISAIEADGPEVGAAITDAGGLARMTFAGTVGQKIFVDVVSATLPDQCGLPALLGPDGRAIATGCVIGGAGFVDGTILPSTGEYAIVVDPIGQNTGQVRLRMIAVHDQHVTITLGGDEVTAVVAQPGGIAQLTFAGTAGQRVIVDVVSATLPDQCGLPVLVGPDGDVLASGCVIGGKGEVAATVLPASGQYTIEVNPGDRRTGQARLRLRS